MLIINRRRRNVSRNRIDTRQLLRLHRLPPSLIVHRQTTGHQLRPLLRPIYSPRRIPRILLYLHQTTVGAQEVDIGKRGRVVERSCVWLMLGERLTNGRTLSRPPGNHQVADPERSRQTCVQGPILQSIDGASKRSRNSAIQSLIVQSDPIDPDCPLPLLFFDSIYR